MSSQFLTDFLSKTDLIKIVSETFTKTISEYTHTLVTASPAVLQNSIQDRETKVAGLIRYEGKDFGFEICMQFSLSAIFLLYKNTFQEEAKDLTAEVKDLAGELLNIAFGTIDPHFKIHGIKMRSSFPKTFVGKDLERLLKKRPSQSILIPMKFENSEFFIDIYPLGSFSEQWSYTIVKS